MHFCCEQCSHYFNCNSSNKDSGYCCPKCAYYSECNFRRGEGDAFLDEVEEELPEENLE